MRCAFALPTLHHQKATHVREQPLNLVIILEESLGAYGGESHFDNMKRFFLSNGFQAIVDENDYEQLVYPGTASSCPLSD